jgi:sugar phosphate permease
MLIGPYSYLAGAVALDFGGKKSGATAAGLIDGVGYLGGILAGNSIANISVTWGWTGAFIALAAVALITAAAGAIFLTHQRRMTT